MNLAWIKFFSRDEKRYNACFSFFGIWILGKSFKCKIHECLRRMKKVYINNNHCAFDKCIALSKPLGIHICIYWKMEREKENVIGGVESFWIYISIDNPNAKCRVPNATRVRNHVFVLVSFFSWQACALGISSKDRNCYQMHSFKLPIQFARTIQCTNHHPTILLVQVHTILVEIHTLWESARSHCSSSQSRKWRFFYVKIFFFILFEGYPLLGYNYIIGVQ